MSREAVINFAPARRLGADGKRGDNDGNPDMRRSHDKEFSLRFFGIIYSSGNGYAIHRTPAVFPASPSLGWR